MALIRIVLGVLILPFSVMAQTGSVRADSPLPDFYQQLQQQQHYPASWTAGNFATPALWRENGRNLLRQSLLWPAESVDFAPVLEKTEQRQGYQAELWSVQLTTYSRIKLLLLRPAQGAPYPAVLLLHDHGARFDIGKEKMIRPFADDPKLISAAQWSDRYFSGNFVGDELAKRGYLVVAADTLGWSDRGPVEFSQQQALASNFLLMGRSLAGMAAYEDLQLVRYIRQLPAVDNTRVAALGFSMGAFRAWQLAALTDDIKAGIAVAWLNRYQHMLVPGNNIIGGQSAFYMLHPGLAGHLDIPDVASLAAPKAMLFINGGKDKLMPIAGVNSAYQRLAEVWQAFSTAEALTTTLWPEYGHEFNATQQQQAYNWLEQQLQIQTEK
ncbi:MULTISPECIES: dienelactone hydrolase family protein [unclassified Arsukibacterium]|uniref:dienelactone hydrolase family protein n=1 Tax=unclassified Arsukibacterium TaxID=2635278 RepID=UPI000C64C26F|nr:MULTISPECIES: alpha/beta hydrolase family protein [unclassified Arsukibacterium]MAA95182.1 hydrolase [Rheinheimera sp.]MBM35143.1 hydrolase [Rheinheimera sp.]HAW93514.1 hydrolase [Candidatus Azambacteria bacterium]|tara:strand:+ start:49444 stop:50592 length:1149 start_codon:yes stop_codon:yes gene_type:complete